MRSCRSGYRRAGLTCRWRRRRVRWRKSALPGFSQNNQDALLALALTGSKFGQRPSDLLGIVDGAVALIGKDISGTDQYWVIHLYKTYNKAGFSFTVTRRDQSKAPFEFMGLAITSRAAGDQIGNFWHMGAANAA